MEFSDVFAGTLTRVIRYFADFIRICNCDIRLSEAAIVFGLIINNVVVTICRGAAIKGSSTSILKFKISHFIGKGNIATLASYRKTVSFTGSVGDYNGCLTGNSYIIFSINTKIEASCFNDTSGNINRIRGINSDCCTCRINRTTGNLKIFALDTCTTINKHIFIISSKRATSYSAALSSKIRCNYCSTVHSEARSINRKTSCYFSTVYNHIFNNERLIRRKLTIKRYFDIWTRNKSISI